MLWLYMKLGLHKVERLSILVNCEGSVITQSADMCQFSEGWRLQKMQQKKLCHHKLSWFFEAMQSSCVSTFWNIESDKATCTPNSCNVADFELMRLSSTQSTTSVQHYLYFSLRCYPLPLAINLQLGCNNVQNVFFNCLVQKHLWLVNLTAKCFMLSARCNSLFFSLKRSWK